MRPIQSEAAQATVMSSLASVDLVVLFAEDTPLSLIETIRPDVLVKGADYRPDQVVGALEPTSSGATAAECFWWTCCRATVRRQRSPGSGNARERPANVRGPGTAGCERPRCCDVSPKNYAAGAVGRWGSVWSYSIVRDDNTRWYVTRTGYATEMVTECLNQ
jgi:hypothetical protein